MRFFLAVLLGLVAAGRAGAQDLYKDSVKYDFGQSRTNLVAIEEEIRKTPVAQYRVVEGKLLGLLQTSGATFAAKQFALRQLRQVGSAQCVPAIAPLLADEKLSHMARYALQGIPGPQVDEAFRAALDKVSGNLKIGLVGSIAQRGDAKAVPQIAALIGGADKALASAALTALGRIGGAEATKILAGASVGADLKLKRDDAYLMCADKMLAQKETSAANKIYREMYAKGNPSVVRVGALRGIMLSEQEKAVPALVEALGEQDAKVQAAAARFLAEIPGASATKAIAAKVTGLPVEQQAIVINQLADRGDKAAGPVVAKLVGSQTESVRVAALKALGALGDAGSVEILLKAAVGKDDAAAAATDSLGRLPGIDEALVSKLGKASAEAKPVLVKALTARNCRTAVPALLKIADSPEVFKALGALTDEKNVPGLVALLVKTDGGADAEGALIDTCRRVDAAKMEGPVLGAAGNSSVNVKCAALRVLGQIGSEKALVAVRGAVNDADEKVQDAAVRSLTTWSDASALPDLMAIAKTGKKETHKILALRGYVKLVGRDGQKDVKNAVKQLGEAMAAASRPDEKKLVIGALAELGSPAAFPALEPYIAEESLRAEAESAYLKIVDALKAKRKNEAIAGLKKFVQIGKTQKQLDRAHKLLADLGVK